MDLRAPPICKNCNSCNSCKIMGQQVALRLLSQLNVAKVRLQMPQKDCVTELNFINGNALSAQFNHPKRSGHKPLLHFAIVFFFRHDRRFFTWESKPRTSKSSLSSNELASVVGLDSWADWKRMTFFLCSYLSINIILIPLRNRLRLPFNAANNSYRQNWTRNANICSQ